MLLVTTTVGMLHGVHGHASHGGPGVALDTELVEGTAGLEHGLIGTSTTGDDSDHGSASIDHSLLGSRGKTDSSNTLVSILCDNDGVVAGSTAHLSTVTDLGLDVANTGALGDLSKRKDVSDGDFGLLSLKDELTSVHALRSSHDDVILLVGISILELDLSDGCSSPGLVHKGLDHSLNIAMSLGVIELVHLHLTDTLAGVGRKDTALTLALRSDNLSHLLLVTL